MPVTELSFSGLRSSRQSGAVVSFIASIMFAVLFLMAPQVMAQGSVPNAVAPTDTYSGTHVPQPIDFPHDIHVRDNEINCMYCHTYARRSKSAGIPPTSKCMGCHNVIATDRPRIQQLTEYWENQQSVPWIKVHDMPDFVHFTHEKHMDRFLFDNEGMSVENVEQVCAFCHGQVREMTVAEKVRPLTMGFCVRCHEANDGPFDCWACHK